MNRFIFIALLAAGGKYTPILGRQVDQLDEEAFREAHQHDDTATRAFTNVQITTSSNECLYVDKLSGDFRANLNPVQVAPCGSTDGQGWDVITKGKHNDQEGQALVVNTLTGVCLNVDPRRPKGKRVNTFSCGGRADGSGEVTDSQLFAFGGERGPSGFIPKNGEGKKCLVVRDGIVDAKRCNEKDQEQYFAFGDVAGGEGDDNSSPVETARQPERTSTAAASPPTTETSAPAPASTSSSPGTARPPDGVPTVNPTSSVPVSRAGGILNPSSAAEAHQFDDTASRSPRDVRLRGPNGKCLSIDPTAGDFRQNLIPIQLVECSDLPSQKFDIVKRGKHNNGEAGKALIVSALTQGCISFDGRRQDGDTVTLFSCGGRAAGEGETDNAQLYPFDGSSEMVLMPESGRNETCLVEGNERLESAPCEEDERQIFEIEQ